MGLVYDQALSGGFITSGLIADACHALPEAEIRVMRIPAMARVTKLPEDKLTALSQSNPVFAPGVEQLRGDGRRARAVDGRPAGRAARGAGRHADATTGARGDGAERGGRRLAAGVVQRVLDAA